jgi:E3 ubiquitin-protein ligase DOA10
MRMAEYICPGGVADVYVEYHGEEDTEDSRSGSDFEEDELLLMSDDEPDVVIAAKPAESSDDVFVTNGSGVVTEVRKSPAKPATARRRSVGTDPVMYSQDPLSQVVNPSGAEQVADAMEHAGEQVQTDSEDSDSDPEYVAHSEDSGENSEVVELRRHARKFKKRMKDTKSWIGMDSKAPIPIELVANMEERIGEEEKDWDFDSSDEDFSYDEDSDGTNC